MRFCALATALFVFFAATSPGQKFVRLEDGTLVEGEVRTRGSRVELVTVLGFRSLNKGSLGVRVTKEEVAHLREQYQDQVSRLPDGFLNGHAAIARWCLQAGYLSGVLEQLRHVLHKDPDCVLAQAVCKDVANTWAFDANEVSDKARDRRRFVRDLFRRYAPKDVVTAVIAYYKADALDADLTLREAIKGLRSPHAGVRWGAARLLARHRRHPERINPLYRRSLLDPAPAVRLQAVRSLAVTKDPVFASLFGKNLFNPKQAIRMTAAQALAELNMSEGVLPLIGALRQGGGNGVRAHIAVTTQRAYVKDFDVEIAQAAVIADPVVDIVQEGAVLDVTVVGVSVERAVYRRALRTLTGRDFGTDWKAWAAWWKSQRREP